MLNKIKDEIKTLITEREDTIEQIKDLSMLLEQCDHERTMPRLIKNLGKLHNQLARLQAKIDILNDMIS